MLPASLSPHKVSRTGKVLEKLPKKKTEKKRIKSPKGRGSGRTKDEHNYLEPKQGRKMWRSFLRKRDRGGMEFDTMDWYRKNVLHPAPKTIVKKETKEKKHYDPSS